MPFFCRQESFSCFSHTIVTKKSAVYGNDCNPSLWTATASCADAAGGVTPCAGHRRRHRWTSRACSRTRAWILLVEADGIASGVTAHTTAKITAQHGLLYDKLLRRFGPEPAALYLRANERAVAAYRRMSEGIDCGFETKDNYVYSRAGRAKLETELRALDKLGHPASFVGSLPLPFAVDGAVCFREQAQFRPLDFLASVVRGLRICEQTKVRELEGMTAVTAAGRIRAEKIIVATHFPFLNKHGLYFMKLYQHRSYVCALENAPLPDGMFVDEDEKGMSFRRSGDFLLLGGGSHRTGKRGGAFGELEAFAARHYPLSRSVYRWATQDCMSLDGVPYVGCYSRRTPDLYVAAGFNKWGMTSSMVAAELLREQDRPVAYVMT
ncbi:MAG: NAD(P)/FAD-dependent oxidoreductase, partial [Acutalibacteraceae bacterium]